MAPALLSPAASPQLGYSSDDADSATGLASPPYGSAGFATAFTSTTTLDSYHDAKDVRFLSTDTLAAMDAEPVDESAPEPLSPWSITASQETARICRRAWDVIGVFQAITLIPLGFYIKAWSDVTGSSLVDALLIDAVLAMWVSIGLSTLALFISHVGYRTLASMSAPALHLPHAALMLAVWIIQFAGNILCARHQLDHVVLKDGSTVDMPAGQALQAFGWTTWIFLVPFCVSAVFAAVRSLQAVELPPDHDLETASIAETDTDAPVQAVSRQARLPSMLFKSADRERERHLIELKRLRLPGFISGGWPATLAAETGVLPPRPRRPRQKVVVNVTAATPRRPKARFAAETTAKTTRPPVVPARPAPRQQTIPQKMTGARHVIAADVEDPVSDDDAPLPTRPTPRSSRPASAPRSAVTKPHTVGLAMHMSDRRLNARVGMEVVSDDEDDERPARRPRSDRKSGPSRSGALGDVSNRARRPSQPTTKLPPSNSQVWIAQAL